MTSEDDTKTDEAPSVDDRRDDAGGLAGPGNVSAAEDEKVDPINDVDLPLASEVEEPNTFRWLPIAIAVALPILFFFALPPLTKSGLWDPYELNVADLARRIALNLYHAGDLALTGADNSLPHLNDLGRPQLPFSSIALGFKMFGLHEWAGRAPLAVWGVLGVVATYGFVARLIDRRAGLYSAIALTTMPLYFVQSRTMLGDVVTMSSFAMAFGGLAVTVFDRREADVPVTKWSIQRTAWFLLALLGLVAGYGSRGGLLGVAVPLVGIGLAWAISWASGERRFELFGDVLGGVALLSGAAISFACVSALSVEKAPDLNLLVGAMIKAPSKYPTFDYYVGHLGPALAPWSGFAPFAIGRLFIAPIGKTGIAFRRESLTRMALVVGAAVAFGAHAYLASRTELIAFCAPAIIAAICGIAIRDFERGAHASVAVGVGTCVFLGLFHHDFHELPEKAYQAFAVAATSFPDSFKDKALLLWTAALVGFAGIVFLTWVERNSKRKPFDPKEYASILTALRNAWDGLLVLSYFAIVAGASLAGLALWVLAKTHSKFLPTLSLQLRDGVLNAWWVAAFVPLVIIFGVYFACDVWLWTFGRARPLSVASLTRGFEPFEELFAQIAGQKKSTRDERLMAALVIFPLMALVIPGAILAYAVTHNARLGVAIALAIPAGVAVFVVLGFIGDLLRGRRALFLAMSGAGVGAIMCFAYYPALANQLSPKEVFETYQRTHKGDEPLALFGVGSRTAAYYIGGQPNEFKAVQPAFQWLIGSDGSRRFLAMKSDELSKLNEMYREHVQPRANLPVLDARSSQIMLVSSTLGSNETNESPLNKIILSKPPNPQHKLEVNMEDKLEVLGYDVTDEQGRLIDSVAPGRKYRMRTYYKVLAPVTTEWEAFIHIDGFHRRHNGDHKPMDGKYPFSLWLTGDLMVDDYEFNLEPNFTPGSYTVFFGLFVGETRLKVKSGPNDGDNRINGGQLRVQ